MSPSADRVVRVGDTVRREPGMRAEFVHRVLLHFEDREWAGAPRFLGSDEQGREILSYVEGAAAQQDMGTFRNSESLSRVARLVREFHDLTAGTALADGREVVCHNDLSPKNTVYDMAGTVARPIAFIDWDLAAPGERIHDVAHMCWQYVGLGPEVADVGAAAEQVWVLCDAYARAGSVAQAGRAEDGDREEGPGRAAAQLGPVIDTVLWWQERCWQGIEAGAVDGDAAMVALRDEGVVDAVRAAWWWVREHRDALVSGGGGVSEIVSS